MGITLTLARINLTIPPLQHVATGIRIWCTHELLCVSLAFTRIRACDQAPSTILAQLRSLSSPALRGLMTSLRGYKFPCAELIVKH